MPCTVAGINSVNSTPLELSVVAPAPKTPLPRIFSSSLSQRPIPRAFSATIVRTLYKGIKKLREPKVSGGLQYYFQQPPVHISMYYLEELIY